MAQHSLERLRLKWRVENWGFCAVEHPRDSWLWKFPLAQWLQELPGAYVLHGVVEVLPWR